MDFLDLTWARRSVRAFKPEHVEPQVLLKLLEAARSAPSGGNDQSWYFYVITDTAVQAQIALAAGQGFVGRAPAVVVVCVDFSRVSKRYGSRGKKLYALQNTAAAIQNLLLCAANEGLGACWCGDFHEKKVAKTLKMKRCLRPVAVIPVGYPHGEALPAKRRPLGEISSFCGCEHPSCKGEEAKGVTVAHRDMSETLFDDVNLANSNFFNINMENCSFEDINFASAKIKQCDLSNVEIDGCNLSGMRVNGAAISDMAEKNN